MVWRMIAVVVALAGLCGQHVRAAEPNWPDTLTILTASQGGTYQEYGAAVAKLLTTKLSVPVGTMATSGPAENLRLLAERKAEIAFVTMGAALQARAEGGAAGRALALFPMYETAFHFIVPRQSPVTRLAGLEGRKIGVGPKDGTGGVYVPRILDALKVKATFVHGSYAELAAQLKSGAIDALIGASGLPFPAIASLDVGGEIRYLAPERADIAAVRLAIPELVETTIWAGTYPSMARNYRTLGQFNFAVARPDMPADLAYALVEAIFTHHGELVEATPAAAATLPANFVQNGVLAYHPGAAAYFSRLIQAGALFAD